MINCIKKRKEDHRKEQGFWNGGGGVKKWAGRLGKRKNAI